MYADYLREKAYETRELGGKVTALHKVGMQVANTTEFKDALDPVSLKVKEIMAKRYGDELTGHSASSRFSYG